MKPSKRVLIPVFTLIASSAAISIDGIDGFAFTNDVDGTDVYSGARDGGELRLSGIDNQYFYIDGGDPVWDASQRFVNLEDGIDFGFLLENIALYSDAVIAGRGIIFEDTEVGAFDYPYRFDVTMNVAQGNDLVTGGYDFSKVADINHDWSTHPVANSIRPGRLFHTDHIGSLASINYFQKSAEKVHLGSDVEGTAATTHVEAYNIAPVPVPVTAPLLITALGALIACRRLPEV